MVVPVANAEFVAVDATWVCVWLALVWPKCSPIGFRWPNLGVRNGVSTYSLPSRSVSGRGSASVTGDIDADVSKLCTNVFCVCDDIVGIAMPGGGGLRLAKLLLVNGTVIGACVSALLGDGDVRGCSCCCCVG